MSKRITYAVILLIAVLIWVVLINFHLILLFLAISFIATLMIITGDMTYIQQKINHTKIRTLWEKKKRA